MKTSFDEKLNIMNYTLPHTIENIVGEKLLFLSAEKGEEDDKLIIENFVAPGFGPLMHTHWLQDESLTVVKGRIGYVVKGGEEQFAGPGETIFFKRGVPHRFWNAGSDELHCKGYIYPAHNVIFYLSSIFAAQNKAGKAEPEIFDGAYLITRYKSEFEVDDIPGFVKKVIMPITYFIGKVLGKYKHFEHAPAPVRK
jgi:quercetin dioxygenase-like cupin family protein